VPDAGGRTNLRLGLVTGCAELLAHGDAPARAAILLSDGKHNKGSFSGAEECFTEAGIPVYAYGIGAVRPYLLKKIADSTGGEFTMLSQVTNLYCEFLRIRTILSGDPPGRCTTFPLGPSDALTLPFHIPPAQDQAVLEVRWRDRRTAEEAAEEGIPIVVQILGPSGTPLEIPFPGITYEEEDGAARYSITRPVDGEWTLIVSATDLVPEEGLFITFSATTITQVSPLYDIVIEEPTETPPPTEEPSPSGSPTEATTPEPTVTPTPRPTRGGAPTDAPIETPEPSPTETTAPIHAPFATPTP
jgi:cell division septation protein DedD